MGFIRDTVQAVVYAITSAFGWRVHNGTREFHTGIDIATPLDTGFYARVPLRIIDVEDRGTESYGKTIVAELPNGNRFRLAHLNSYNVTPGQNVAAGTLISRTGSSGNSTGAHLHFELRAANGDLIDPTRHWNEYGTGYLTGTPGSSTPTPTPSPTSPTTPPPQSYQDWWKENPPRPDENPVEHYQRWVEEAGVPVFGVDVAGALTAWVGDLLRGILGLFRTPALLAGVAIVGGAIALAFIASGTWQFSRPDKLTLPEAVA